MREGFLEITSGWMLTDDVEGLSDIIQRAAIWTEANGPLLEDEQATVHTMIQCQIARGIRRGDFAPFIPADTDVFDVLNFDVERKR